MGRCGLTLMEVLMTVIVVAILATMALPNFTKTIERQYYRGAQDALLAVYAGEQVYFTVNNQYYPGTPATLALWRDNLYTDDPNLLTGAVTYVITNPLGAATTFTATARRVGGSCCDNGTLSINQNRTITPGGAWPPP